MGFHRGPKIVTDGLIVYFDAANPKSYTSGSSVWRDLSGNINNGTFNGDPTFVNDKALQFNGDDFVSANIGITLDDNKTFSVSTLFMVTGIPGSGNVMGIIGRNEPNRWGIDHYFVGEQLRFGVRGSSQNIVTTHFDSNDYNKWHYAVLVHENTGEGTGIVKAYLNETFIGQNSYSDAWTADNEVRIASSNAGLGGTIENLIGKVNEPRIYNRELVEAEIKQNFNATKRRFGL